jgi:hypothetical protein
VTIDGLIEELTALRRQHSGEVEVCVSDGEWGHYPAAALAVRTLYVPNEVYTGGPRERLCVILSADVVYAWRAENKFCPPYQETDPTKDA